MTEGIDELCLNIAISSFTKKIT